MRPALFRMTLLAAAFPAVASAQGLGFFSVGTGELDGGYFRVAQALCAAVNDANPDRLRCSPETTAGSIYNLVALAEGQLDLALAQSDWQAHAWNGSSVFAMHGPFADLRSVLSLHLEPVVLVVREGAGIARFDDIAGTRVDLGHPSSGRRATMMALLDAHGLDEGDLAAVTELQGAAALAELCAGRIDATLLITGHPSRAVAHALEDCALDLVGLQGAAVQRLVDEQAGFVAGRIARSAYPDRLARDIRTFAVRATLVARTDTPDAVVGAMVAAALDVIRDPDQRAAREPLLAELDPEAMDSDGLTAPLHPAARAAFDAR